jgi:hypothetical protein
VDWSLGAGPIWLVTFVVVCASVIIGAVIMERVARV